MRSSASPSEAFTGPAVRAPRAPRPAASSLEELLAGAEQRTGMDPNSHSLSSATFERVVIGGDPYVVKHLHPDQDWVMRATSDLTCRAAYLWCRGWFDLLPPSLDHTIVGVATGLGRNGWGAALLMRDVGDTFTPEGDGRIETEQHRRFLEHMADLHVQFWGLRDEPGLLPPASRWLMLSPWVADAEAETGDRELIPRLVGQGWAQLDRVSPAGAALADELFHDPAPLAEALAATPSTLVHGDWKFGNLGSHPDGRTVLVDWAFPGPGAPCADLSWYLAVNTARLPESKEATIEHYRAALEERGIATAPWWEAQLALACLGGFLLMGWDKGMAGRDAEFCWWEERALDARRYLR